jgi:hypothetical protein
MCIPDNFVIDDVLHELQKFQYKKDGRTKVKVDYAEPN